MATAKAKPLDNVQDHLIAGTIAGLTSTVLLFPLDLIKTKYQVHDQGRRPYRSVWTGLKTIAREEGVRGLYKGLTPSMLASGMSWGGYFLFYEKAKRRYLQKRERLGAFYHLISAMEAGVIMVFITNPLWLIKTRMQLQQLPQKPPPPPATTSITAIAPTVINSAFNGAAQAAPRSYTGVMDAFKTIVKEEGVLGLYKGVLPALLLTTHGAIQFMTYEALKTATEPYQPLPTIAYSVLGGFSKIVAGLATYPTQVIKARLQQRQGVGGQRWIYEGTWDCIVKIWKYEGVLGFFKGCVPNVLKTAPAAAITFVVYEQIMRWFHEYRAALLCDDNQRRGAALPDGGHRAR